jgi:type IV fimbrial biogenesis protein FimT
MKRLSVRRGFTLPELMIVVAVAAILLTLSAPSLFEFIRIQRLKGVHAQVMTDMQFARTEAASRGLAVNVYIRPASADNAVACYILFTDTDRDEVPSQRCDCQRPEGNRCTSADASEIRSVLLETGGIALAVPGNQADHFAFDPISGSMIYPVTEDGAGDGEPFQIITSLDTARSLGVSVGVSGRPSACKPTGSTMNEPGTACPVAAPPAP